MNPKENGWSKERDWAGHSPKREIHPSENYSNNGTGCSVDRATGEDNDERYVDIGRNNLFHLKEGVI